MLDYYDNTTNRINFYYFLKDYKRKMNYVISGATYLSRAIVIAVFMTAVIYIVKIHKMNLYKIIVCYTFNTYVVTLGFITGLLQQPWNFSTQISCNYLPFYDDVTQMTLNYLLFIPMGILLPMISSKLGTSFRLGGVVLGVSIGIEVIQMFFLGRFADINDVIANTLGGISGFMLYVLFRKTILDKRETNFGIGTLSIYFSIIGLFLGLEKNGVSIGDVILYNWGINTLKGEIYTNCIMLFFGMAGLLVGWKNGDAFLSCEGKKVSMLLLIVTLMKVIF